MALMGRSTGCHDVVEYVAPRKPATTTTAGKRPYVHGAIFHLFLPELADERLGRSFGRLPRETPLGILYSGKDKHVPDFVDKEGLVRRYLSLAEQGCASVSRTTFGVVLGTGHSVGGNNDGDVLNDTLLRVVRFLGELK